MKVYVLLQENVYTDYEFCGIFSTREKAQQKIDDILAEYEREEGLYIEEFELA